MYVGKEYHLWDKWLHIIKFTCNDHLHSSIGFSQFYVLYGQTCRALITHSTSNDMIREINEIGSRES